MKIHLKFGEYATRKPDWYYINGYWESDGYIKNNMIRYFAGGLINICLIGKIKPKDIIVNL